MKQILIIDDEKDILKSVNAILSEEGYKCYEALNSKDALNIYNSQKIDLILLDVWLEDSDHDGIEILEIIPIGTSWLNKKLVFYPIIKKMRIILII